MANSVISYDEVQLTTAKDGSYKSATVPYVVTNVSNEDEAVVWATSLANAYYGNLIQDGATVLERLNDSTYKVGVNYNPPTPKDKDQTDWDLFMSFDTGGGTVHMTQSLGTVAKYPADAPDYGGAINYDGETVNGCDVTRPVLNISYTKNWYAHEVDDDYIALLAHKTGMYNNDSFKGFAPGEVLFLGASGRTTGDDSGDLCEVTYNFAVAQNQSDLTIGSLTGIEKKGWQYLWVRYEDQLSSGKVLKQPVAVYVEKVNYGTDFTSLGIDN